MQALGPEALADLPADVERPAYDRSALQPGIVHLGLGQFVRAHLAVATEAAIRARGDLRWGILGVAMSRRESRDALVAQQGLYTVALRDCDADGRPRQSLQVPGCLMPGVVLASEQPQAVLEAIADPQARIVSLTITEKGYLPEIVVEERPDAIDLLVRGLELRHARHASPLTLLSLDNLPANGPMLRRRVIQEAEQRSTELAQWIDGQCSFPSSMVDRIVPQLSAADRTSVSAALGCIDAAPVVAERYFDWVVEDEFANGRPDWNRGGARFVADAAPWEKLKLRCVNGSHSAIAYLGAMAGWATVHEAMQQEALRVFVDELLREELVPTLDALPGFDIDRYVRELLRRFANPALAHRTQQIAMDGSQKLPQRLLAPLRERLDAGLPVPRLALAVAAWLHYLRGVDENGRPYRVEDPLADALTAASEASLAAPDLYGRVERLVETLPIFESLVGQSVLVHGVASALDDLQTVGVRAALMRCTNLY